MTAAWLNNNPRSSVLFAVLLPAMLLLHAPSGHLSADEEQYLLAASLFFSNGSATDYPVLFGGLPHIFLFSVVAGPLVHVFGFEWGQILGRCLTAVLFAGAFAYFFRVCKLQLIEAVLVLVVFVACRQSLIGHEWTFGQFQPKTLAYPFGLLAIAFLIAGRATSWAIASALCLSFHFLIGAAFAGFSVLVVLWRGWWSPQWRNALAVFCVLSVPALVTVFQHYGAHLDLTSIGGANVDLILKQDRYAKLVDPYVDLSTFVVHWLPGALAMIPIIGIGYARSRSRDRVESCLGSLAVAIGVFLLLALIVTRLDHEGRLGPFLIFRSSSLHLLVGLVLFVIVARQIIDSQRHRLAAATVGLALSLAACIPALVITLVDPALGSARREALKRPILDYVREHTEPRSMFIVDQDLENDFLDFQRKTARPIWVLYKFVPTQKKDIVEWNDRLVQRDRILAGDCELAARAGVRHAIVLPRQAQSLQSRCAAVEFSTANYAVLRWTQPPATASDN